MKSSQIHFLSTLIVNDYILINRIHLTSLTTFIVNNRQYLYFIQNPHFVHRNLFYSQTLTLLISYFIQSLLYSIQCLLYSIQFYFIRFNFTLFNSMFTLFNSFLLYSIQFYFIRFKAYFIRFITYLLNPTLSIPHGLFSKRKNYPKLGIFYLFTIHSSGFSLIYKLLHIYFQMS